MTAAVSAVWPNLLIQYVMRTSWWGQSMGDTKNQLCSGKMVHEKHERHERLVCVFSFRAFSVFRGQFSHCEIISVRWQILQSLFGILPS